MSDVLASLCTVIFQTCSFVFKLTFRCTIRTTPRLPLDYPWTYSTPGLINATVANMLSTVTDITS